MSTPKPPKQFRLTFKAEYDFEYHEDGTHTKTEGPPLAYAVVYTPNTKTYPKQVQSQDDWAYAENHRNSDLRPAYFVQDDKFWTRRSRWEMKPGMTRELAQGLGHDQVWDIITAETQVPDYLQPRIIDNVPLEGFRIQHMVARYKGNKLWRILDPRGFELEILSGVLEDLLMTGVVDRGLIVGPCIWAGPKNLKRV